MKTRALQHILGHSWLLLALAVWPALGNAQVAVADIEAVEELPLATTAELETLVGPIALYPDDLLAIVLPASTFPVQIIEASRFLQDLEDDASLKPDEDWNDAVVALLNYPEVVDLLNEDLDWLWRLGEAVVAQQADVISAIEMFRDRAYAAGNLKSDDYQLVAHEGSSIQITPVQEDVIYVPYYEPERVVVYQPRPVYYYYPRSYPVYYYPYPEYHSFHDSFFWGVTTAFSIGWHHHHLNVYHHSYFGHPYYGHSYYDNWWYRSPHINVYNNVYVNRNVHVTNDRYRDGDRWYPSSRRTVRASDQRVTRSRYYPSSNTRDSNSTISSNQPTRSNSAFSDPNRTGPADRNEDKAKWTTPKIASETSPPIKFRNRPTTSDTSRNNPVSARPSTIKPSVIQREPTTARPGTVRPTTQPKQTVVRQSQPKQTVVRQSQPKQTVVRQSQPKQTVVRQSQPRQSQPKVSQPRQSQPSRSASPSKSSSPQRSQSSSSSSSPRNYSSSKSSSSQSNRSERSASQSKDR